MPSRGDDEYIVNTLDMKMNTYIHSHTRTHVRTHTLTHTHTHTHTYVCVYRCTYARIDICIICKHVRAYMYIMIVAVISTATRLGNNCFIIN